jgi:hypothetical protein
MECKAVLLSGGDSGDIVRPGGHARLTELVVTPGNYRAE